jgi:hypothetical protein
MKKLLAAALVAASCMTAVPAHASQWVIVGLMWLTNGASGFNLQVFQVPAVVNPSSTLNAFTTNANCTTALNAITAAISTSNGVCIQID